MKNIIYGLRCPKTDDYKYIGKSAAGIKRAESHLTLSHNEYINEWVEDLRKDGMIPFVDVIEADLEEGDLIKREAFWIKHYEDAGCNLFNVSKHANRSIIENKINFGKFIKNRRKVLKVSQKTLAEMSNISVRTMNEFENWNTNITIQNLVTMLDILGYELKPMLKNGL